MVSIARFNPSPQSSPLGKGRGGIMHDGGDGKSEVHLGPGLPPAADSRGFAHEVWVSDYLRSILRS